MHPPHTPPCNYHHPINLHRAGTVSSPTSNHDSIHRHETRYEPVNLPTNPLIPPVLHVYTYNPPYTQRRTPKKNTNPPKPPRLPLPFLTKPHRTNITNSPFSPRFHPSPHTTPLHMIHTQTLSLNPTQPPPSPKNLKPLTHTHFPPSPNPRRGKKNYKQA